MGGVGVAEGLSPRAAARTMSLREFVFRIIRKRVYPSDLVQNSPLLARRCEDEFESIYCPHLLDGISVAQDWPRVRLKTSAV